MSTLDAIIHILAFLAITGALIWYGFVFAPAMFKAIDCAYEMPTCEKTANPTKANRKDREYEHIWNWYKQW